MSSSSCSVRDMYPELMEAAKVGDTETLYELVCHNPKIWEEIDAIPFADTPLHMVASFGDHEQTQSSQHQKRAGFAIEMAILKPSFTRKLDPQGYTPMHLALLHKAWTTVRALMSHEPDLVRVKGKGGKTPLHVAAEKAPPQLLAELLLVCPSAVEDVTGRWQTAMHIAVEASELDSFKVLLGWLLRVDKAGLLFWKDIDGNTVLHLATLKNQIEVVEKLLKLMRDDTENFNGEKAITIYERTALSEEIGRLLRQKKPGIVATFIRGLLGILNYVAEYIRWYKSVSNSGLKKYLIYDIPELERVTRRFMRGSKYVGVGNEKSRQVVMVIATLVATATYQSILSPPGGFWQDDSSSSSISNATTPIAAAASNITRPHSAGKIVLDNTLISNFMACNSAAFMVSIILLIACIPASFAFGMYLLFILFFFLYAYRYAVHSIIPHGGKKLGRSILDMYTAFAIISGAICVCFHVFVFFFRRIDFELKKEGRRHIWPLLEPIDRDDNGQRNNCIDLGN